MRAIGVCGIWYHCISQYDRLWKRHYIDAEPIVTSPYRFKDGAGTRTFYGVAHQSNGPAAITTSPDLPPHLNLKSAIGSVYARAWLWAQMSYSTSHLLANNSLLDIVRSQPRAYIKCGLARSRYVLPIPATSGYLSSDGLLLATVHRSTPLLSPNAVTPPFTTVLLFHVDQPVSVRRLTILLQTTSINVFFFSLSQCAEWKPWRRIAHPPPACCEVVISLELGYAVLRNDIMLSVYQLTGILDTSASLNSLT
jgi:hypothetical protein